MSTSLEVLNVEGRDVSLDMLTPLNERQVATEKNSGFRKIVASVRAIGLIEPLCVYPEAGRYVILDGFLRYMACRQLGIASVPCLVYPDKQAYTFNRNVNRLTPYQEIRMLRRSLESLDEPTIAQTFGLQSLRARLVPNLIRQLHPTVVSAFKENRISRQCALEFAFVLPERQVEIYTEMKRVGDFSPAFCRALVIQSPPAQRCRSRQPRKSWAQDDARRKGMMSRLDHAEKQHSFYAQLYRQYTADLLKTVFYVRKLLDCPNVDRKSVV